MKKKILVTGYKKFDKYVVNPSKLIAEAVDGLTYFKGDRSRHEVAVIGRGIDVDWDTAWVDTEKYIKEYQPDALVSFGVADCNEFIIETIAHNDMSGNIQDRTEKRAYYPDGRIKNGEIIPGGPFKIPTILPVTFLLEKFKANKGKIESFTPKEVAAKIIGATTGNDAKDYLCNFMFYNEMYHPCARSIPVRGFVHVPNATQLREGESTNVKTSIISMASIIQSGALIVEAIAEFIAAKSKVFTDAELDPKLVKPEPLRIN